MRARLFDRSRPFRCGLVLALLPWFGSCSSIPIPLDEALEALPDGPAAIVDDEATSDRLERARRSIEGGTWRTAHSDLASLVRERPRLVAARSLLATILVLELERDELRDSKPRAREAFRPEDRLDAIQEAEFVVLGGLRYAPNDAMLHALLGRIYEVDGHLEAAVVAYRRAVALDGRDTNALLALTRLELDLGEERAAVFHLEALRARLSELPIEALTWEARCYMALHDTLLSERATGDQASNKKTYLDRARRAYDELAARSPIDARAMAGGAYCRFLQMSEGDVPRTESSIEEALDLYRRAARLAPTDATHRFDLGVFLESGLVADAPAAIGEYRSALARDPSHLPSQLNLARLLWQGHPPESPERAEARQLWALALPRLDGRERRRVEALLAR